jgi:hypothetical protein
MFISSVDVGILMMFVQDKDVIKIRNVVVHKMNIVCGKILKMYVYSKHQQTVNHVPIVINAHQWVNTVYEILRMDRCFLNVVINLKKLPKLIIVIVILMNIVSLIILSTKMNAKQISKIVVVFNVYKNINIVTKIYQIKHFIVIKSNK